jgi:uncharacterized protein (DUF1330 family)
VKGYAVGHLRAVNMGPAIIEYLQRIDATLAPFGGRFIVHGAAPQVMEGSWPGHLIVIEFPTIERANAWYASPAYQAILPLRTQNSAGDIILIEGVDDTHRATDVLVPA